MTYSSPVFLLLFLPIVIILFYLSKGSYKSLIILCASFLFYIFTNPYFFPILIVLTWINYSLGEKIHSDRDQSNKSKTFLVIGVCLNAFALLAMKFLDAYGVNLVATALPEWVHQFLSNIALPLGFSYITFQNIAYLFDIHNKRSEPETSLLDFLYYTFFFPKILVGPIMRHREMQEDIKKPKPDLDRVYKGGRRIILGLAKKVLIADTIARAINPSFELSSPEFSTGMAWFMLIGYAIQLYYDFSGLTDMALGMGEIFGIQLMENFNFPYNAESISEFWRRWHISLSSWVRDYIFIPLEFKRRRVIIARQQTNILIAFLVMGIWHGLTPNFVFWGMLNGFFLALEMSFLSKLLKKAWKPLRHIYTLSTVLLSWIFFRSNSLAFGFKFIARLFATGGEISPQPYVFTRPLPIIDHSVWLVLVIGILFSFPFLPSLIKKLITNTQKAALKTYGTIGYDLILLFLLMLSLASIVSTNTVGNIYGGF